MWTVERKANLISALLLFAVTSALIVLKSARDALFLNDFPTRYLPYFMGINTIVSAFIALAYIRLYRHFSLKWVVGSSLLVFIGGTLVFWLGVVSGWPQVTMFLFIWVGIFGTLAPVQAWSLISERLLARQARRSLGIIGSGAIIGGMIGGLFARWGAEYWDVSILLPIAAVLILAAFCISQIPTAPVLLSNEPIESVAQPKFRKEFINLVLVVIGCVTLVSAFADFQFKAISQKEFVTAEKLAVFFGSFYAYFGAATLLFQIFLTPVLMRWLALPITLAILPAALLMGNGFLYLAGSLTAAIFLKGSEQLFKNSVDRSSMEVLFLALPEMDRVRIQSTVNTVGVRLSEGVGALLLTILFSIAQLPLYISALAGTFFSMIALGAIVLLAREYARALRGSIHKKELQFSVDRSNVFTSDFYTFLPDVLKKSKKDVILDLLEVLSEKKIQTPHLEILLGHPEAEVRLKALALLSGRKDDRSSKVEPLLKDEDRRVRLEALRYLSWRTSMNPQELLTHVKGIPDEALRSTISLMKPDVNGENELDEFMKNSKEDLRLEVAKVLGYLKPTLEAEGIYKKLLFDPNKDVQKAILQSIARTTPAGLVPDLIDALIASPLLSEIRSSLERYGESLLPELSKMLEDKKKSRDQKKVIVKIADTVGGPQASEMLINTARGSDLVLRFSAIKAMNQLKKRRALVLPEQSLESLLEQEIEALNFENQRLAFIQPAPGGLADRVLRQRQAWALERIFRVLGLLYDPRSMYYAYLALQSGNVRRIDSALELLDTILKSEHRRRILALVEAPEEESKVRYHPDAKKSMLIGYIGAGDQLPAAALIMELKEKELESFRPELERALNVFADVSLVKETLNWRYSEMNDQVLKASRALTTVQKLESLAKVDIFSRLGPHELFLLANQSVEVELEPGQVIFQEGDKPSYIFSLISGQAERYRTSGSLEIIPVGESFGGLAVVTNQPHFYSARAVDRCLCLKLDQESFLDVMEDQPAIAVNILQVVHQKMLKLIVQMERLEEKLASHGDFLKRPS